MFLMRLLLLFLFGIMLRRLYRAFRSNMQRGASQKRDGVNSPSGEQADPDYADLTEQGIDDADFEEIP